jgi:hypothetical protein
MLSRTVTIAREEEVEEAVKKQNFANELNTLAGFRCEVQQLNKKHIKKYDLFLINTLVVLVMHSQYITDAKDDWLKLFILQNSNGLVLEKRKISITKKTLVASAGTNSFHLKRKNNLLFRCQSEE